MKPFDVYPLFDIEPVKGRDMWVYDRAGTRYLDLYGGHAVISVGHSHPKYLERLHEQADRLIFYSNSIQNPLQDELAEKLGRLSGLEDFSLFLCNSGAEANENALKLASFHTGRSVVVAFGKAFHGRTSAAVAATDNPSIQAPINRNHPVVFLELGDLEGLHRTFREHEVAAVLIEGIQGVGGIYEPCAHLLKAIRQLCTQHGAVMILDEIQSGYGRSGHFFAYQKVKDLQPDLITVAKGMGNGFPIGGVLISPMFKAVHGMLGTTFGGNHLACAAACSVLDIIREENLMENAARMGEYLLGQLQPMEGVKAVRGRGLMLGIELYGPAAPVRNTLLKQHRIFTGSASEKHTVRLLPPLTMQQSHAEQFLEAFAEVLSNTPVPAGK